MKSKLTLWSWLSLALLALLLSEVSIGFMSPICRNLFVSLCMVVGVLFIIVLAARRFGPAPLLTWAWLAAVSLTFMAFYSWWNFLPKEGQDALCWAIGGANAVYALLLLLRIPRNRQ